MREIKFRAWDKQEKRFWYDAEKYQSFTDLNGKSDYCGFDRFLRDDRFIVEQFTGLLDCQGVEIYEGDIVEYENGNAGYGRPRHEEISRDVIPELNNHDEYVDNISWWQGGAVIGNIHEHPELLEEARS